MTFGAAPEELATHGGQPARGVPRPRLGEVLGPLPAWAVAAIVGALAGETDIARDRRLMVAITVAAVVAVLFTIAAARRPDSRKGGAWLALAAVLLVSCAGTQLRVDTLERGLLPVLAAHGGVASLSVVIAEEPRPITSGWHVVVRVDEVDGVPTRERAALMVDEVPPPLGSRWQARATARPLPAGGYGGWLERQHAAVVLDLVRWRPAGDPGPLAAASENMRARVRWAATRHLGDRVGGLLVGFVTGDTRLLSEDDRDAMRATGLTHLTAVSGSNLAIVVGGMIGLAAVLGIGASGRRWLVAGVVLWFAFVTRFEPSILRAGTMAGLVLLAGARGVARDTRHALAGAVLLLVLLDPRLAGSLGLLLSATATLGVLAVAPLVRARMPARLPRRLAELASITIGAQLAVVPVMLMTFGEVSLASVPANLIAVPAAAVAATLAFVGTALTLVHGGTAAVVFALGGPPASIVLDAAHGLRHVGGTVSVARPLAVSALLAGGAWVLTGPGTRAARRLAATVTLLAVVAAVPAALGGMPKAGFTLTAIDVGQGDAFLLEAAGTRLLFDAGADGTAAAWLGANGRRRIDLLVVSHAHLDHVGGAADVLHRTRVGALWFNPGVPTDVPEVAELLRVAGERGVPVRAPAAGDSVGLGPMTIEVLHPRPGRPHRFAGSEANESSYVLRIEHGGRRVLLTGDVEAAGQGELLAADPERLHAELMTVPHHGSRTTDPRFLAAVSPRVAVISAGRDNRHGHPHAETLGALEELGIEVRRTDVEGAVRVDVPGRSSHTLGLRSGDDSRDPHRRLRRPAPPTGGRAPDRRTPRRGPRTGGRHPRRLRDRPSARAAYHVAVRRSDLRRTSWGGEPDG